MVKDKVGKWKPVPEKTYLVVPYEYNNIYFIEARKSTGHGEVHNNWFADALLWDKRNIPIEDVNGGWTWVWKNAPVTRDTREPDERFTRSSFCR
jgi:hypothetical protein